MFKSKRFFLLCFLVIGVTVGCLFFFFSKSDSTDKKTAEKKEKTSAIVTLGKSDLTSAGDMEVIQLEWDDDMPKDIRFVLVDNNLTLTNSQTKRLQTLVKEKYIVFFYGESVTQFDVQEKLDVTFDEIELGSSSNIVYPLYGYGYSTQDKMELPLFFGINPYGVNTPEKLQRQIFQFLNTFEI